MKNPDTQKLEDYFSLAIKATIIEANKWDARISNKGIIDYQPILEIIVEIISRVSQNSEKEISPCWKE